MIINVPIEPIPMRYSVDWDNWFTQEFENEGIPYISVYGKELTKGIEVGSFLDCIGTNYYKSSQLMKILEMIYKKQIQDGDVLFFHDLWFPGIEQIRYTCDALDRDIKITGCLHAGSYDPNDFLYRAGMTRWAIHFEHMLFTLVDTIFVATQYHANLLCNSRSIDPNKIRVTGFPIYFNKILTSIDDHDKENIIVFPHRKDPEKNWHLFTDIRKLVDNLYDWRWVYTEDDAATKAEYYDILKKAKIALSFSDQETWGIAMQEAMACGCIPLVPRKLSYIEMYDPIFQYNSFTELIIKLRLIPGKTDDICPSYKISHKSNLAHLIKCGKQAISNILNEIFERDFF